mmetsp:Transcript_57830/g.159640  ORF Transcript_57830/g.159640 Transcript_57830/m.159640 type:complete len:280 (-) Transcript_57830:158-997(-)
MRRDPNHPYGQIGSACSDEDLATAEALGTDRWADLVPFTPLQPGYAESRHHFFDVSGFGRVTHLRLNMFPDGGIARLRVHGRVSPNWDTMAASAEVDLCSVLNGGLGISCSNRHFGVPGNLLGIGRGVNMGDGWETARHLHRPPVLVMGADGNIKDLESDWAVIQLGAIGTVHRVQIDTAHFKGNFPESCRVDACYEPNHQDQAFEGDACAQRKWVPLLPRTKLGADRIVDFTVAAGEVMHAGPISHVRLSIFPDGGISRLRLFGTREPEKGGALRSRL